MSEADKLHFTAFRAQFEVDELAKLAEQAAVTIRAAEQRATKAEAALKRSQQRLAALKTAPDDLVRAARAYLDKMDGITTDAFACGAEKAEREALRAVLDAIEGIESEP